ncbi:MAG: T9SS type A sorting domain-containing protein [Flavobacteriales bacterium]|jgi:hypothetical protein|nr:T9SS type A sorting domain-containing protein [Flavobacteriales bacterium]
MKHIYPVLLSAHLFAGTAAAQPIIDQSNFAASPGESFVLNASAWMDPGASGANVTWDFSGLVIDSAFTYAYVDPASTPMTDSFPTATLAHAENAGYAYRSFDATGGYYLGYHMDQDAVVDYQDPEMTFQFPCTYGTQWVDDLFADYLPGPSWFYAGSINAEADGYGTLILPYGTFTNVLRLHLTRSYTLETPWPEDGFYVDTIYYYLHPGTHYPLVEVFTNSSGEEGGEPIVTTGVRWLSDPFAGIQGAVASANTLVAVAQGDGLVRLDLSLNAGGAVTIDVIDAAGRIVAQDRLGLGAGASSHTLAVSALRPGLYTVRMLLNGQQMTTRLVMP